MVLYRKYRPATLSELDLSEVREKLAKTLASSYRPHAYLFSGPKGTGKTSAARIVAKILNCKNPKSGGGIEPCNVCESCNSISKGTNLDVLEIDAASNRGIDEIRDLREKIKLAPLSEKFKVYIIDEVHMLTNDAFNALLKTLEEPPQHAVFILATTDPDKLPDTIISRSTNFVFKKASVEEIKHSLVRVKQGEKFKIDDEALGLISEFADGSFRDATKYLEQAVNENLNTAAEIRSLLGFDRITSAEFLFMLKKNDTKGLLKSIIAMGETGADFKLFVADILNLLHLLLLKAHGIEKLNTGGKLDEIFTKAEINKLIKLFSDVYSELRFASRPELPLETAVVEWNLVGKEV